MTNEPSLPARDVARIVKSEFKAGRAEGHRARRLIDGHDVAASDPFILMAEDFMPRGAFGHHPHRGLETVTLVLDGVVEHFDSAGNEGLIKTGDAQWMTAGRGVIHNESALPDTIAHTLQLWVNLPAADKMAEPRYQTLHADDLPVRRERGVDVRVLSGQSGDAVSPTLNYVPVTGLDARIASGGSFDQVLQPDHNVFLYVIEGEARVGKKAELVAAGEVAWLTREDGKHRSTVTIAAGDVATRFVLFAGRPLREPVAMGGPFVMNTKAEVDQAFADYRAGRF